MAAQRGRAHQEVKRVRLVTARLRDSWTARTRPGRRHGAVNHVIKAPDEVKHILINWACVCLQGEVAVKWSCHGRRRCSDCLTDRERLKGYRKGGHASLHSFKKTAGVWCPSHTLNPGKRVANIYCGEGCDILKQLRQYVSQHITTILHNQQQHRHNHKNCKLTKVLVSLAGSHTQAVLSSG